MKKNGEEKKPKIQRGFALLSADRMREIARSGGQTAHQTGKAHQWTAEEARAAGRKGGKLSRPGSKNKKN